MSRIILKKYPDTDESHIVVGWDRPCASYFWQEFNAEPTIEQLVDGRWQVSSYSHNGVYDTEAEAESHKWDGWEEVVRFAGYMFNELPTMRDFLLSVPDDLRPLMTDEVQRLLDQHSTHPDPGSIVVDLTTSNVVMGSFKVEVLAHGETRWATNATRWATKEEAEEAAKDLAGRWTMLKEWRIAESSDPVNYKWENGRAVSVPAA